MTLYKYRGLQSFKFLVDILLKSRLYAAPYCDLNDPMEGQYLLSPSGSIDEDMQSMLNSQTDMFRICSFSQTPDNQLMWAHYAEGHRGLVLGVEICESDCVVREIVYEGPLKIGRHNFNPNAPLEVLSRKLSAWEYEEEVRAFVKNRFFIGVEIKEIILGSRMSNQDKSLVKELCRRTCPNASVSKAST
ncbi:hypothetical protein [Wenzhouxiangella sp. EGI_FJ10409]|uniref:hypothetical protein n=1 Tax=Wenzhouxiangella sp. EGI_FJ10409 TaxID=3243767 RepID=UPI0035DD1641